MIEEMTIIANPRTCWIMTKLVKMRMIKFVLKVIDHEYFCSNPKIHKPVVNNLLKFRLILSAINTPGYNLAKFLILILEPLNRNEFI